MADPIIQVEDVHTLMDDQAQAGSTKERRGSGKALSRSLFFSWFQRMSGILTDSDAQSGV